MPYRARQRHVEQAQILRQPLRLGQLNALVGLAKIQHRLKGGTIVIEGLVLCPVVGDKRQPDQRILQPFGFMNGDDLHQMLVALQPELLAGGVAVRLGDMLRQPAHQRMLALGMRSRLL